MKSYKVDKKNMVVVMFSNIEQTPTDKMIIDTYVRNGYTLKSEKKTSVEDMRKELELCAEALEEFNRLYELNEVGGALGFHRACQYYTKFKKIAKVKKDLAKDEKSLKEFNEINDLTETGLSKALDYYKAWKKDNKSK